jgi:SAM-dependent methyltransferase
MAYVHGYDERANERLHDQARTLVDLLHDDTAYPAGSLVLEAGCGVGAQTVTLAQRSPQAQFVSIDVEADSVAAARRRVEEAGVTNVELRQADIFASPFEAASFDHVFVCFVLEHLSQPVEALAILKGALKPGGTITVIEGDHGSAYFHPDSAAAHDAIRCQIDYVDASRPELVDGFTRKTFTAMIEGVREDAIAAGLMDPERFDAGIRDLYRTAEADGVFCYTFFKGVGVAA